MKAIILAGGMGTRLRPVTYEIPKPLLTVKKKPIINHLIDLFRRHNVSEIGVLISRQHEADFERWKKTWQNELPKDISIFFEEKPRGTFGGLEYLKDWIGRGTFILSNGDELKDFDLTRLVGFHKTQNPLGTIALVQVPNPQEYGVPVLDEHRVIDFLEKPNPAPSNFISSGLYALEPRVLDYADFAKEVVMIEKDIFPKLAKDKKLNGLKMEGGRWFDCGNLERWEKAIREW